MARRCLSPSVITTSAFESVTAILKTWKSSLLNLPYWYEATKSISHQAGVSSFATHAVVSQQSCVKISESQRERMNDDALAAVFGCAVITGVGAVVNTAQVRMGASVGIVGLGGVGMCALLGALAAGAREVIAIDIHQSKLDMALMLGATAAFNANDPDLIAKVKVYDMLNQNQGFSRTISATTIRDEENTVLKRYAMFSLTYKIQNFAGVRRPSRNMYRGDNFNDNRNDNFREN